jgi:hypothetical protein
MITDKSRIRTLNILTGRNCPVGQGRLQHPFEQIKDREEHRKAFPLGFL